MRAGEGGSEFADAECPGIVTESKFLMWFQQCSSAELRLIAKLAEATARKKELPTAIARMSDEVHTLKSKYAEVLAATRIEKLTKKATAKAVHGKRARN